MKWPSLLVLLLVGCSCGGPTSVVRPEPPPLAGPTYEVHEWGLVRGTVDDRVMLSGPHAEPVMVVTKPVLYFHRAGEGALTVDVEARISSGRIVEHWPALGGDPGDHVVWRGVLIQDGSCRGSRYPTLGEDPCNRLTDACEASTLAGVETNDSSCLYWPPPPGDDGPTMAWNHLFYRGEVTGYPPLPLRAEPQPDGTLRLTATGSDPIPGTILRIRRANHTPGVTDAVEVVTPPAPGSTIVVPAPSRPLSDGGEALGASLRAAGLTDPEVAAFRAAWDGALFGDDPFWGSAVTAVVTTTPPAPIVRPPTTSLLYVLPAAAADGVAVLTFTPPPTAVRRAIVMWVDETSSN